MATTSDIEAIAGNFISFNSFIEYALRYKSVNLDQLLDLNVNAVDSLSNQVNILQM
jgi:hypothetical protein